MPDKIRTEIELEIEQKNKDDKHIFPLLYIVH